MSHLPRPDCKCVSCVASRGKQYDHKTTCMCLRCRQIKNGVKVIVVVPKKTLDRIEGYVRYLNISRPDILREAFELWLKVADYKREQQETEHGGGAL